MRLGYFVIVLSFVSWSVFAATPNNQKPPVPENSTIIDDGGSLRIVDQAEAQRIQAERRSTEAADSTPTVPAGETVQAGEAAQPQQSPPLVQPSNAQQN